MSSLQYLLAEIQNLKPIPAVAHQLLDDLQGHALHGQMASVAVTTIVPADLALVPADAGLAKSPGEGSLELALGEGAAVLVAEDVGAFQVAMATERLDDRCRDLHRPGPAPLRRALDAVPDRPPDVDAALDEIHAAPLEADQLAQS